MYFVVVSVPIFSNPDVDLESQAASLDHIVPAYRLTESGNGSNGFTLVSGGDVKETGGSLSHHMKVSQVGENILYNITVEPSKFKLM